MVDCRLRGRVSPGPGSAEGTNPAFLAASVGGNSVSYLGLLTGSGVGTVSYWEIGGWLLVCMHPRWQGPKK